MVSSEVTASRLIRWPRLRPFLKLKFQLYRFHAIFTSTANSPVLSMQIVLQTFPSSSSVKDTSSTCFLLEHSKRFQPGFSLTGSFTTSPLVSFKVSIFSILSFLSVRWLFLLCQFTGCFTEVAFEDGWQRGQYVFLRLKVDNISAPTFGNRPAVFLSAVYTP